MFLLRNSVHQMLERIILKKIGQAYNPEPDIKMQLRLILSILSCIHIFRGPLAHRVLQGRHILVYFSVSWLASLLFNRRHKITWRLKGERVVVVGDYQSQNSQRTKASRFLQFNRLTLSLSKKSMNMISKLQLLI